MQELRKSFLWERALPAEGSNPKGFGLQGIEYLPVAQLDSAQDSDSVKVAKQKTHRW